jgi:hypothetical protein
MLAGLPHDLTRPRPGVLQCPMLPDGILQTTRQSGPYRSVPNPGKPKATRKATRSINDASRNRRAPPTFPRVRRQRSVASSVCCPARGPLVHAQ